MRALVCAVVAAIGLAAHPAFAQADRTAAPFWKTVQATCDVTAAKPPARINAGRKGPRNVDRGKESDAALAMDKASRCGFDAILYYGPNFNTVPHLHCNHLQH